MLERGATTVWEAWNGIDRDGQPHESLNHYSKGAVIAFLHEYVAGIRPASAGYDRVDIRPQIDARLTWAEGTLLTRHGLIRSRWEVRDDQIDITVRLPAHTSGTLLLPDGTQRELGGGDAAFTVGRPRPGQRIPYPDTRRGLTLRG
jgi:alpha-L-rhamnosidase